MARLLIYPTYRTRLPPYTAIVPPSALAPGYPIPTRDGYPQPVAFGGLPSLEAASAAVRKIGASRGQVLATTDTGYVRQDIEVASDGRIYGREDGKRRPITRGVKNPGGFSFEIVDDAERQKVGPSGRLRRYPRATSLSAAQAADLARWAFAHYPEVSSVKVTRGVRSEMMFSPDMSVRPMMRSRARHSR